MARRSKGEGSLVELPDGRWRARITIDGKTVTRDRTTRPAAVDALKELRASAALGVTPTRWTVETWLHHWIEHIADLTPTTRQGYGWPIKNYIRPAIGRKQLGALKPEDLERLYRRLEVGEGTPHGKPLAPNTVRKVHTIMRRALTVAAQRGHVTVNVATLVEPPKAGRTAMTTMSTEDARRVLRQAVADGQGARWALALMLGLRPGEALGLSWDCVDGDRLHVRQQLHYIAHQGLILHRSAKSDAGHRTIPLPRAVQDLLAEHRQRQLQWMIEEGDDWSAWTPPGEADPVLLVFTGHRGLPVAPAYDGTLWKRLLERAGVPHTRRYTARHTAASLLIAEGVEVPVVAAQLGHTDASFTMRTYVHPLEDRQRAAADMMGRLLG